MKKNVKVILALLIAACVCSGVSFAASVKDKQLYLRKNVRQQSNKIESVYQTDIWVVNHSDYIVKLDVPEWNIVSKLYPGDFDNIFSEQYYHYVEIVLSTSDGYVFFDEDVANHTTVTIDNPSFRSNKKLVRVTVLPKSK